MEIRIKIDVFFSIKIDVYTYKIGTVPFNKLKYF